MEEENVQSVIFFSYKVFPIAFLEGLIKVVRATTLAQILKDHGSVLNYLNSLTEDENTLKRYKNNYFKSCG